MSTTLVAEKPKKKARQKRAQERMSLILAVTEGLVLKEGPSEVTTTRIAQEADIPVGSIYKYFGDKNELLFALYRGVFAEVMSELKQELRETPTNSSFITIANRLHLRFMRSCEEHESYIPLTRWANAYRPELRSSDFDGNEIGEMFEEALARGNIKLPVNRRETILRTWISLTSTLVDNAFDEEDANVRKKLIDEIGVVQSAYIKAVTEG